MKLTLTYNDVSVAASALQLKAREAQINAKKSRAKIEVEFWQERAETYKKTYEALEAQRLQMLGEYEQADAALMETEVEGDGERNTITAKNQA